MLKQFFFINSFQTQSPQRLCSTDAAKPAAVSGTDSPKYIEQKSRDGHYLIDLEAKPATPPTTGQYNALLEEEMKVGNESTGFDSPKLVNNANDSSLNYQELYFTLLEKYKKFEQVLSKSGEVKLMSGASNSGKLSGWYFSCVLGFGPYRIN